MPAISGEGRALFDAVVAQGIAGVMARQRTSPYLSGVRSRLWRFIPAVRSTKRARRGSDEARDRLEAPTGAANAPVIALISRLPLPLLDEDG